MTDPTQPGGFDLGGLLEQAQAMQHQMLEAQEAQANTVVEGSSGGGMVTIAMTGAGEFRSVSIKPEAIADGDAEMVEDLYRKAESTAQLPTESGALSLADSETADDFYFTLLEVHRVCADSLGWERTYDTTQDLD